LHSKPALEFLIGSVGSDHVLLGSDYPFDMGNLDCVARVREAAISAEAQHFILGGYARTLLNEVRANA
jgi:aminocarboxymuconate-semialdehyde decarboxylase